MDLSATYYHGYGRAYHGKKRAFLSMTTAFFVTGELQLRSVAAIAARNTRHDVGFV